MIKSVEMDDLLRVAYSRSEKTQKIPAEEKKSGGDLDDVTVTTHGSLHYVNRKNFTAHNM